MVNSRRRNKLEIFENFEIDYNLPKYTKGVKTELTGTIIQGQTIVDGSTFIISNGTATTGGWGTAVVQGNVWGDVPEAVPFEPKKPFWKKWFSKNKEVVVEKKRTMTILSFFSSLANSLNDLKTLQDIAIHYETAISNAAKGGQKALVDKLKNRLESAKTEAQLVMLKLNKYLQEEQVVDFYNQADKDKNLKLTWIKNFVKPIPTDILEVKKNLDEQFVFDNYVILHYDPNNDATDLTDAQKEEQKRREKDPILFGVIKDSRRLYYVADWIDDYCDLTLDTVIETLGERVSELNNNNVKTYLDLGERKDERIKVNKHNYASGFTKSFPIMHEKVVEKLKKAKETFTKSVKDFMPKRPSLSKKPKTAPKKKATPKKTAKHKK